MFTFFLTFLKIRYRTQQANVLFLAVCLFLGLVCLVSFSILRKKVLVVAPTLWCTFVKTLNLSLAVKFRDFYSWYFWFSCFEITCSWFPITPKECTSTYINWRYGLFFYCQGMCAYCLFFFLSTFRNLHENCGSLQRIWIC